LLTRLPVTGGGHWLPPTNGVDVGAIVLVGVVLAVGEAAGVSVGLFVAATVGVDVGAVSDGVADGVAVGVGPGVEVMLGTGVALGRGGEVGVAVDVRASDVVRITLSKKYVSPGALLPASQIRRRPSVTGEEKPWVVNEMSKTCQLVVKSRFKLFKP
jgi:hypothetical protein